MSEAPPTAESKRWPWLTAGLLGVSGVVYVGMLLAVGREIPPGVQVGPVSVGHMTQAEARTAIADYAKLLGERTLELHAGKSVAETTVSQLGLAIDVDATLARVPINDWNPLTMLMVMVQGQKVAPVITADERLSQVLTTLAEEVDAPAIDASIRFVSGQPAVVSAQTGAALDQVAAVGVIKAAVAAGLPALQIGLPTSEQKPEISDTDARNYIESVVKVAVSGSVVVDVTDDPKLHNEFTASDLRAAARFRVTNGKLAIYADPAGLASRADAEFLAATQPVRDATWDVSSGVPVVVPSQSGFGVSDQALAAAVESVWLSSTDRRTTVTFEPLDPKLTTAAVEKLGVKELMASYKQRFPAATYRSINIGRAAELINGTLLMPGAEFSMNNTIKERTEENGYTSGWIIGPGGVFQYEPGGGVSTATTATFNAAWFSGMEFRQWRAHSIYISRYPAGREATVSWGSLDMRFRNPYDTAVFITTKMSPTSITVYFWGTKHWEQIGSVFGPWTNLTTAGTVYNDSEQCEAQKPVPGFDITVWRTFFENGEIVKREPFRSRYAPSPTVICTFQANQTPSG